MPIVNEDDRQGRAAVFAREPVGPKNAASKGGVGDMALMDAVGIVVGAWLILFVITFSLRRHNA